MLHAEKVPHDSSDKQKIKFLVTLSLYGQFLLCQLSLQQLLSTPMFVGFRRGEEIHQPPPTHPCNLFRAVWSRHFIWDQSATVHALCLGTANLHNRIYNLPSSLRQSATVIKEITALYKHFGSFIFTSIDMKYHTKFCNCIHCIMLLVGSPVQYYPGLLSISILV